MSRLALAAIVKDEAPHLREWLAYYRLRGVAHVYLAVNDDDPAPLEGLLAPLVDAGWITVKPWPGPAQQLPAYNWAVGEALKDGYEWVACLDADEFLVSASGMDLPLALDGLNAGAIAVNWRVYGHRGLEAMPASVLESNVWRLPHTHRWNQHVKVIVQPEAVKGFILPHTVWLKRGWQTRTPEGVVVDGPFAPITARTGSVLTLAHYPLRSRADWVCKMRRGRADLPPDDQPHWDWAFHDLLDRAATEYDDTMAREVPAVQAMQRTIWGEG